MLSFRRLPIALIVGLVGALLCDTSSLCACQIRRLRIHPSTRPYCLFTWRSDNTVVWWHGLGTSFQAKEISLPAGTIHDMPALSRTLKSYLTPYTQVRGPLVSPDGRYAIWQDSVGRQSDAFVVAALDGSFLRVVPLDRRIGRDWQYYPTIGCWRADSSGWIAFMVDANLADVQTFDLQRDGAGVTVSGPMHVDWPLPWAVNLDEPDVAPLVQDRETKAFVATTFKPGQRGTVDLLRFHLEEKDSMVIKSTLQLPKGARVDWMSLSPACDKLAWVFYFERPIPGKKGTVRRSTEVWISGSDGSNMHKIAGRTLHSDDEVSPFSSDLIEDVEWSPSGKLISFWDRDALCIAPVDAQHTP